MKNSSLSDYVMDALGDIDGIRSRAMFGGEGLYVKDVFFGLIWKGRLYLRVDDAVRPDYESRGSKPFVYSRDGVSRTMNYYEAPVDILEDHDELRRWVERAVRASSEAKKTKKTKPRRR
jgi:DNA transformation protein